VIYTAGVLFWRLSDDLNGIAESFVERFRRRR